MITVIDCLGRERAPDRVYEDGSYNCPFCWAAVGAGTPERAASKCPNPACFARFAPPFPTERAREILAEEERKERERQEREQRKADLAEFFEEQRKEREDRERAIEREAEARGACVRCARESARFGRQPKYVKHRKTCPKG